MSFPLRNPFFPTSHTRPLSNKVRPDFGRVGRIRLLWQGFTGTRATARGAEHARNPVWIPSRNAANRPALDQIGLTPQPRGDAGDAKVALKDLAGKWVVLFFYPRDDTPG